MHYFTQSIIQARVKDFFTHSIESSRFAHAYILYGAQGRGKEAFAFELAKVLNCTDAENRPCNSCPSCIKINNLSHPDIKYIFPVSKQLTSEQEAEIIRSKAKNPYLPVSVPGHLTISIEAIRALKNEAKYAAFEATKRVFIISGAEYFSREAANSFLKLLEEPPENLVLILITDDIKMLLDTIRSRCQPVYFPEFSDQQIIEILEKHSADIPNVESLVRISQHNIKRIYQLMHSEHEQMQQSVYDFIKSIAAQNFYSVSTIIDSLTQKRDKNILLEFLNLIILWFRDSMHFLALEDSSDFVNLNFEEQIKNFADYYRHIEMEKVIGLAEQARNHLNMNAHPALTLTNLAIEMKNVLTQKKPIREAV